MSDYIGFPHDSQVLKIEIPGQHTFTAEKD